MRSRRSMDAKVIGRVSGEGRWMMCRAPPATATTRRERERERERKRERK